MAACYKVASLLLACDYLDYILFSSIHKLCPMVVVTCEEPNRTRSQREQYLCTPRDISKLQVPPSVQSYRFASLWWTHHSWPGHPENLQNEKLTHQIASRDFFSSTCCFSPLYTYCSETWWNHALKLGMNMYSQDKSTIHVFLFHYRIRKAHVITHFCRKWKCGHFLCLCGTANCKTAIHELVVFSLPITKAFLKVKSFRAIF